VGVGVLWVRGGGGGGGWEGGKQGQDADHYLMRYEHGNDSFFHGAVEPDSLIAVLWHFSCFTN